MPLGVSPTGKQQLAHPSGELATAKGIRRFISVVKIFFSNIFHCLREFPATQSADTVFILSAFSSHTIEDVTKAAPRGIKWMQTMLHSDRNCTLHCVRKAEEAGFKAIVMTVDNAILPKTKAGILDGISDLK